jgi:hypothetical protein
MNMLARWSSFAIAFLMYPAVGFCQAAGTDGAAFLEIPVGAGPAAVGSAYSASADDVYAPVWNPAGLGWVDHHQLAAQHLSFLESVNYEFLAVALPAGHNRSIGFSAQYLGSGDIAQTTPDGSPDGRYSSHYGAYSVAMGQKLNDTVALGITGKWIHSRLADVSANAYAGDVGALYWPNRRLRLAATVNNLGTALKFDQQSDHLPRSLHLAATYEFSRQFNSSIEGIYNFAGELSGRFGAAWQPLNFIALRAGYRSETRKELSTVSGFSLGLGLWAWGQEFAYAWLPYGDLGTTHYISLVMHFGEKARNRQNLIQYKAIRPAKNSKRTLDDSETLQLMETLEQNEKERIAERKPGSAR